MVTLHGDIWTTRCLDCGDERTEPGRLHEELPPRCEGCGGALRPAVVWFGEMLPTEPLERIERFISERDPVDVVLVVGTSGVFGHIQRWALAPRERGAIVIEINPEPSALSELVDIQLQGAAGEILPRLIER
jgi:NAD-dependent deacetylase